MVQKIGVVVLNYNDAATTIKMVDGIKEYNVISRIVIVDNCSLDNSFNVLYDYFLNFNKIDVIQSQRNGGYGYGNNEGIRYLKDCGIARIAVCNPDVMFEEETLIALNAFLNETKDAAVAAPVMRNSEGEKQTITAWNIPTYWQYCMFSSVVLSRFCSSFFIDSFVLDMTDAVEVGCVAGSMLLIAFDKLGNTVAYDENIFLYCEETVLGICVYNCGYKTYLLPSYSFMHYHSVSVKKSIPDLVSQQKIMWKSRLYVLDKYMHSNMFKRLFSRICMHVSIFEVKFKVKRGL